MLESLITESCGSSSMASVCGGCLALLDAGVPLTTSVAGVAMGVLLDDVDDPVVLTDILGIEDALGGMDFKVAGSREGISAFQLDVKELGLKAATLEKALAPYHQCRDLGIARDHREHATRGASGGKVVVSFRERHPPVKKITVLLLEAREDGVAGNQIMERLRRGSSHHLVRVRLKKLHTHDTVVRDDLVL